MGEARVKSNREKEHDQKVGEEREWGELLLSQEGSEHLHSQLVVFSFKDCRVGSIP